MLTSLRPARPEDLDRIRRLLTDGKLPTGGVEEHLAEGYVVAEENAAPAAARENREGTALIGVCGMEVHGAFGLLRSLAVAPAARGRSTGRALVENRLDWARSRGLREVYLLTTDADRYFERLGFIRRSRDGAPPEISGCLEFRSLCPATAVVMSIPLGNSRRS